VKITVLNFGANGGPGKIDAKVGKRKVKNFGKLSGGTLTRDGFGAKLNGVVAKLGKKGAKALREALSGGGKGKASAAAGGIKAGQPLGTASVTSVPKTVEVLPGGTLLSRPILSSPSNWPTTASTPRFPIPRHQPIARVRSLCCSSSTSGHREHRPDFSSGRVTSASGRRSPRTTPVRPVASAGLHPGPADRNLGLPDRVRGSVRRQAFASAQVLPSGPIGIGALGHSTCRRRTRAAHSASSDSSVDPNTKQIVVSNAQVTMDSLSAVVFNNVFPNGSGNRARTS
jgi:hypothetical protein